MKNIEKRSNVFCELDDGKRFRVDGCIRQMIKMLNDFGIQTKGSCCGHGRYPLSIVYRTCHNGVETFYELVTGVKIPRTRNFYRTDEDGFYYIPEALEFYNLEEK